MDLLLDILGMALLLLACGVLVIVLALTMPVRVGFEAHGDQRLDGGSGTVRLFGGAFGAGARADRGTRRKSSRLRLTIGLMVWHWFLPLYRQFLDGAEEAAGGVDSDTSPPDTPGNAPSAPIGVGETGADPVPTQRAESTTVPLDLPASASPTLTPPIETLPVEDQSEATKDRGDAAATFTADADTQARGATDKREQTPSGAMGILERLRDARNEWWPVIRGVWRRLRGIIRVRRFYVDGTIGLGDPALTGQVVGLALSLRGLSAPTGILAILGIDRGALRINVDPVFEQFAISGRIESEWRISLRRIWSAAIYVGWVLLRRELAQRKQRKLSNINGHERASGGYEPSKS